VVPFPTTTESVGLKKGLGAEDQQERQTALQSSAFETLENRGQVHTILRRNSEGSAENPLNSLSEIMFFLKERLAN
jgi:hypothetical protein